ncbi:MAG: hypothetical protein ACREDR_07870 [Blastocatellia bacterium]
MTVKLIKGGKYKEKKAEERKAQKKAAKRATVDQVVVTAQSWVDEFRAQKALGIPSPFREDSKKLETECAETA